jgi:hypothetical protein
MAGSHAVLTAAWIRAVFWDSVQGFADPVRLEGVFDCGDAGPSAGSGCLRRVEFFGEANVIANVAKMRAPIGRYRRAPIGPCEDPVIGCLFVRDVPFFPAECRRGPAAVRAQHRAGQEL